MRDPHVERVHYKIGCGEGTSYQDPRPLEFFNRLGRFAAKDGRLTVEPADHFADQDAALAVIDPFVRGWEIVSDLTGNIGTIRFKFEKMDIIDRSPPSPGSHHLIDVQAVAWEFTTSTPTIHITRRTYPDPPETFQTTGDVELAYQRWRAFKEGRESLQTMAYFIYTLFKSKAGGVKEAEAARVFDVDRKILGKVSELSSTRGGPATARKASSSRQFNDLTGSEKEWLNQAVRLLIRRLGEHASGEPIARLKLDDLPCL